jgi:hypothetical protein
MAAMNQILTDELNKSQVCIRWVPRLLTVEQKERRAAICQQWLSMFRRQGQHTAQYTATVMDDLNISHLPIHHIQFKWHHVNFCISHT